jgi:hypothetical protein
MYRSWGMQSNEYTSKLRSNTQDNTSLPVREGMFCDPKRPYPFTGRQAVAEIAEK